MHLSALRIQIALSYMHSQITPRYSEFKPNDLFPSYHKANLAILTKAQV